MMMLLMEMEIEMEMEMGRWRCIGIIYRSIHIIINPKQKRVVQIIYEKIKIRSESKETRLCGQTVTFERV